MLEFYTNRVASHLFKYRLDSLVSLYVFSVVHIIEFNEVIDRKTCCIYIKFYRKGCHGRLCNTFEVFFRALPERPEKLRLPFSTVIPQCPSPYSTIILSPTMLLPLYPWTAISASCPSPSNIMPIGVLLSPAVSSLLVSLFLIPRILNEA